MRPRASLCVPDQVSSSYSVCTHGVCYLHSPPTYLGWSWILCPPVSSLPSGFSHCLHCDICLLCNPYLSGDGEEWEVGLGEGYVPIDLSGFLWAPGPPYHTRGNNWWGI